MQRLLSHRDIPLRQRTLWRMLYKTAARAAEILSRNVEDLDLENNRAPLTSKGGDTEWVHWDACTARLLPRLLRILHGPVRTQGLVPRIQNAAVAGQPGASGRCPLIMIRRAAAAGCGPVAWTVPEPRRA